MDSRIKEIKELLVESLVAYDVMVTDLTEDLRINIYDLEEDCAGHSNCFLQAALFLSEVALLASKSDLLLKELRAEIAIEVRSNPEKYGIQKITEAQITEAVDTAKYVKEILRLRSECQSLKANADAFVQAFEHRRSMLNNEVQLYLSKLSEPNATIKRKDTLAKITEKKEQKRTKRMGV